MYFNGAPNKYKIQNLTILKPKPHLPGKKKKEKKKPYQEINSIPYLFPPLLPSLP